MTFMAFNIGTSSAFEDYVDFSDMGSYDHGSQINELTQKRNIIPTRSSTSPKSEVSTTLSSCTKDESLENSTRPLKYLKRVVNSLLSQMDVKSHVFGPNEAITIDLQAEIHYSDYSELISFSQIPDRETKDKHLTRIDEILSNMLTVVKHGSPAITVLEFIMNMPIFNNLKFGITFLTMVVICFLIATLSYRTFRERSTVLMLLNGFVVIFILSCLWTYCYMYENARATLHAKFVQHSSSQPSDCNYENFGFTESVWYFVRVSMFGYEDRCEEFYKVTMNDPFWSINPLEAISQSFSVMVFYPFGYIGERIGMFMNGIIKGIPFWLQPFFGLFAFIFLFMGLFRYRVMFPLLTIEPAYPSSTQCPAITQQHQEIQQKPSTDLIERPDQAVMKSIKDASTDMDGFDVYLSGFNVPKSTIFDHLAFKKLFKVLEVVLSFLDLCLRQCPVYELSDTEDSDATQSEDDFQSSEDPSQSLEHDTQSLEGDTRSLSESPSHEESDDEEIVEEDNEDIVIPRRSIHRPVDDLKKSDCCETESVDRT